MSGALDKSNPVILVVVAMVAGAAGFFAGASFTPFQTGSSADKASAPGASAIRSGMAAGDAAAQEAGARKKAEVEEASWPTMTLAQAFALTDPKRRDREMENILATAPLGSIKSGLDWALALPEGFPKLAALQSILNRWGQLDGPAAAAYGEQVLTATGRPDLLEEALRGWGQSDPAAALAHAQSMPVANDVRRSLSRSVMRDWADRSPQSAAAFAAANKIEVGHGGWPDMIADRWSKQDPSAAARWAASLPAGEAQQRAYDEVVQNWCDLNLQSAADFVSGQAPGPNKEVMVSTLAKEVAKLDQRSALQWVSTLTDPVIQEDTAWSVVRRLARDDPSAALDMLQSSALPATVQQTLATRIAASQNEPGRNGGRGR